MKNPNTGPQSPTFALEALKERVDVTKHLGNRALAPELVTVYNGMENTGYSFDLNKVEKPAEDVVHANVGGMVLDIAGLPGKDHFVIHDASDPEKAPVIKVVDQETTADKPLLTIQMSEAQPAAGQFADQEQLAA